jgi:CheY-like chemotaxis protein
MANHTRKEARVLVADDDQAIRQLVCTIIKREGLEIDCAADGAEAIELLREHEYSVILLDLMMPRVDGHGVLRFLESERPAEKPWVIVMTANMQGAQATANASAVFRVLPKPFDIKQLISDVKECHQLG